MMRYYTGRHKFTCSVDLHARTMFLCVLDERGYPRLEKNIKTEPELFLRAIEPYREDVVVAVECMFTWYWLADLCSRESCQGTASFAKLGDAKFYESCLLVVGGWGSAPGPA